MDVGGGTGILTPMGSVCIDPSQKMLERAMGRGLKVVRGKAEYLPFRDSSFDHVLMTAAISFFSDPHISIGEASRVIRGDGTISICFINSHSPWGDLYKKKASKGHPLYSQARFLDIDDIERIMSENGIEIDLVISCLQSEPGEELAENDVVEGASGGFVCARGKRSQARG